MVLVRAANGKVVAGGTITARVPSATLTGPVPVRPAAGAAAATAGGASATATATMTLADGGSLVDRTPITLIRKTTRVALRTDVLFAPGSASLSRAGVIALRKVAARISGSRQVRCEGHTDNEGDDAADQQLALGRATAVCKLIGQHVRKKVVVSLGETRPVASNATPTGRAKNRRVEVTITN